LAVHRKARAISELAADSRQFQTEELIERYGNQWLATARRSCSNSADAEDAYQRALEALLTKAPAEDDPERIAAWVHTVVKNEALQMVRGRRRELDTEFEVIVGGLASDDAQPEESLVDSESHGIAKEALRRLRPDQTRCLLLRADGFDYPEICSITGFSYAKVNRLLSEGRKSARLQVAAIDGGRECDRVEPLLSLIADGEADAAVQQDARLHLEGCARCRATLRDYTLAPRDLAAAMPLGVAAIHSRGRVLRCPSEWGQWRFGARGLEEGACCDRSWRDSRRRGGRDSQSDKRQQAFQGAKRASASCRQAARLSDFRS
jgi:RNA polymerase sigma factor (sigma-70 family)